MPGLPRAEKTFPAVPNKNLRGPQKRGMCMCACACDVDLHVHVQGACACACAWAWAWAYACVCVCVCVYVYIYRERDTNAYIHIYICIYMCVCMCVYVYVYIYIYILLIHLNSVFICVYSMKDFCDAHGQPAQAEALQIQLRCSARAPSMHPSGTFTMKMRSSKPTWLQDCRNLQG